MESGPVAIELLESPVGSAESSGTEAVVDALSAPDGDEVPVMTAPTREGTATTTVKIVSAGLMGV